MAAFDPIAGISFLAYKLLMSTVAHAMLWLFIFAWCMGAVANIYATR
jgi:hypothetical protein